MDGERKNSIFATTIFLTHFQGLLKNYTYLKTHRFWSSLHHSKPQCQFWPRIVLKGWKIISLVMLNFVTRWRCDLHYLFVTPCGPVCPVQKLAKELAESVAGK